MFVRLLFMMGVVVFVCGRPLYDMRPIVIVGVVVFVAMLMGMDGTSRMCMLMVVGVNVCMGVFFFFHRSSSFLVDSSSLVFEHRAYLKFINKKERSQGFIRFQE
jgi:hypothetical protein